MNFISKQPLENSLSANDPGCETLFYHVQLCIGHVIVNRVESGLVWATIALPIRAFVHVAAASLERSVVHVVARLITSVLKGMLKAKPVSDLMNNRILVLWIGEIFILSFNETAIIGDDIARRVGFGEFASSTRNEPRSEEEVEVSIASLTKRYPHISLIRFGSRVSIGAGPGCIDDPGSFNQVKREVMCCESTVEMVNLTLYYIFLS